MVESSRRGLLLGLTSGTVALSGCSFVDELGKLADDSASMGARGADNVVDSANKEGDTPTPPGDSITNTTSIQEIGEMVAFSIDQETTIESGDYSYWEINLPARRSSGDLPISIEYTVIVRQGPPIDIIFTNHEEFNHLQSGERYQYMNGSSFATTYASREDKIDTIQRYMFIIDNSGLGEASPPSNKSGEAVVDVDLTIT